MLTPEQCQSICNQHDLYWDGRRDEMRQLRNLYMTRFFGSERPVLDTVLRTEVPKAYAVVESYLGSLYAKNPSVEVQADIRGRGNPEVAEATANTYLLTVREQLEDATRLALIYPAGFIKLAPVMSADPLRRVSCAALPPWEVIVDATSSSWEQQRYVGHVYLMPLLEAAQRYSKSRGSCALGLTRSGLSPQASQARTRFWASVTLPRRPPKSSGSGWWSCTTCFMTPWWCGRQTMPMGKSTFSRG